MPPLSLRSGQNSNKKMASLIAKQMAKVLPDLVNQLNQNASNSVNSHATNPPHCSFKHFNSCNPTKFQGTEGATGLLQWFESIESTFLNCDCPDNLKVRYATSVLQKRALTWWNGEKRNRGADVAMALTWEEVKELMTRKFCPRNEVRKLEAEFWDLKQDSGENIAYNDRFHELNLLVPITPLSKAIERYIGGLPMEIQDTVLGRDPDTLEDAIHLAAQLTDNHVKAGSLTRKGEKKSVGKITEKSTAETVKETKVESSTRNNKRKAKSFNYVAVTPAVPVNQVAPMVQLAPITQVPAKKPYTGPHPECNICKYHHIPGAQCRQCTNCGRYGHTFNICRSAARAPGNAPVAPPPAAITQKPACFQCGDPTHFRNRCPQLANVQQPARGRVFNINALQAQANDEVVLDQ